MAVPQRHRGRVLGGVGVAAAAVLALLVTVDASSHREAPLITEDPVADNTDVYAFVSPDDPDSVTLISNWIPFEEPAGGPNFFNFGEDVLYQINVDNNADAVDDIVYEFRFNTIINNPNTFLYNTGPITSLDDPDWNLRQTYSVTKVENGVRTELGTNLPVPPNNIGPRSTPNYQELAEAATIELSDGTKVFAGQRDDAFAADTGSIFDLGGLRPFNPAHLVPLPQEPGQDNLAGFNVHSIALQVPKAQLTTAVDYFDDDQGNVHEQSINAITQRRISTGTGMGYAPNNAVSRAEMASFLVRSLGLAPSTNDQFTDDDDSVHEGAINALAEAGITGGCGENVFCPDNPVSRAQMATFLVNALDLTASSNDQFTDDNGNTHEANINALAAAGVTGGCAPGRYCPDNAVSRAQMATFLVKAFDIPLGAEEPVIGVYSTTYRRGTRVFTGNDSAQPAHQGPWVQVSRLGNPLVNEVVIPLGQKDRWNASKPSADTQFLPFVVDPELGKLIPVLYPGVTVPPAPRNDLVAIFLTGLPGLNQVPGGTPSEMIRLNTAIAPTGTDPNTQNRLGLLGGQNDGFPNGRRLVDDTVDIELRAVAGATPFTPTFNVAPNNALGDGVNFNDMPSLGSFPYMPTPHQGYESPHSAPGSTDTQQTTP